MSMRSAGSSCGKGKCVLPVGCACSVLICSHIFFFSSRRRHTILQGDWSSDVCSSDLERKKRIELARFEHGLECASLAQEIDLDRFGQVQRQQRALGRCIETADEPVDVVRRNAVVVRQHAFHEHEPARAVLGCADALALEILRDADAGARPHIDAVVAKNLRQGDRDRDERTVALALEADVGGERHLRDVELAFLQHARERLARAHHLDVEIDAGRLDAAVHQRTAAVIVPAGERQRKVGHRALPPDQAAPLSRSIASMIFDLRACASSRFSRSPSTTSSGALARKFALPSLASTRLMSASTLAISFSSRARSAARSMTPLSGSAATSPRTSSCTAPCGAVSANEMSPRRASRLRNSLHRLARALVSADTAVSASGIGVAGEMFISARTERIAVMRSTTQPISLSAAASSRPSSCGHGASASSVARGLAPSLAPWAVTAHSSLVTNGMNGCSRASTWSRTQATIAWVSVLAAPSGPVSTGLTSSMYQSQ